MRSRNASLVLEPVATRRGSVFTTVSQQQEVKVLAGSVSYWSTSAIGCALESSLSLKKKKSMYISIAEYLVWLVSA